MIKDRVLELLEDSRGSYISGQTIAQMLGVSRNAVWKAVKSLEKSGYAVESVNNKGYRLSAHSDPISAQSVNKYLHARDFYRVQTKRSVTSTNDVIKQLAAEGCPEGAVLIAENQTNGRGRLGRSFYSPDRSGIYMSLLLRPTLDASESLKITTAAAVAVASAIEQTLGLSPKIKWVNDIYLNGRKVSGILTEAALSIENGGLEYAVLGIGINMTEPEGGFPEKIRDIAAALCKTADSELKSLLCACVLDNFLEIYKNIGKKSCIDEYRARSLLTGRTVTAVQGSCKYKADVIGIDDDFRLIIRTENGERRLSAGEVSVKLNADK